jgi:hypothetical protein
MIRRLHLVPFVLLVLLASAPAEAATPGTLRGSVRDSSGTPQVGAVVQLLRADQSVIASVLTDAKGRYTFSAVLPGRYALKAMAVSFLPSLREDVRVRSGAVVNLTLNTLFEVMQWLPAEPRSPGSRPDDWAWTLRSAANRPLLRWLEDGPLVVVSDGAGSTPRLKARLLATGEAGTFGESGERFSATLEDTPSDSRELLARVEFSPDSHAGMESQLGFLQDLGYAGSVQSLAAVEVQPEIQSGAGEGLEEASMLSSETIHVGDGLTAEVGSQEVFARFQRHASDSILTALPFVTVGWQQGTSRFSYRLATAPSPREGREETAMPAVAMAAGRLTLEHGLHQEIAYQRRTDSTSLSLRLYADRIQNPVLEARGQSAALSSDRDALVDPTQGLLRVAAPGFSSAGLLASWERQFAGGVGLRLSYANGSALVLPATVHPTGLPQLVSSARPHRTQMYSLSLSGTLEGTGTRWRASYRWQPEETVSPVAPFAADALDPWFNLRIHQPLLRSAGGGSRLEAQFDLRNLLAQGYRPYLLNDGSLLVFAQDQRSVRGGMALVF